MINEVLDIKMRKNDAGAETIREYLTKLLLELWDQGEGFRGKKSFGNSGWKNDIYSALAANGCVESTTVDEGDEVVYELEDYEKANDLIEKAISELLN